MKPSGASRLQKAMNMLMIPSSSLNNKYMMKKTFMLLLGLMAHACAMSQGITFNTTLSWKEVVAKAKQENKPIFVDAYTTWCGPCIQMDREVFPLKVVGDFYNQHFVNYKIQMDKTGKDSEEIKSRYADAEWFEKTFNIVSYPCYLFFDAEGNLVHQSGGGKLTGEQFVAIGLEALNPDMRLNNLDKLYLEGNRSVQFMKNYIQKLAGASDPKLEAVADEFIKLQADEFSEEAVDMMMFMTFGAESPYFRKLLESRDAFVRVKGVDKVEQYYAKVIEGGVTDKALNISIDPVSGKQSYQVDEEGLRNYFRQFYPTAQAELYASFNAAKYAKLFDPELSYQKAKKIVQMVNPGPLSVSQAGQLGSMVLRDGSNTEDVKAVLDFVQQYRDVQDYQMNQLLCKVYHFSGEGEISQMYAIKAMEILAASRPGYIKVSPEEYIKKAIVVMPTPKIMTN
jgi:thioredoxin-related protein